MNKVAFLNSLKVELEKINVIDIEDIIMDYDEHIECRLLDGYSFEEIMARLGTPNDLAAKYTGEGKTGGIEKSLRGTLLFFETLTFYLVFPVFAAFLVVMAAATLSILVIGASYLLSFNPFDLLPTMPYWNGALFALMFVSLSVLMGVLTIHIYKLCIQLYLVFRRFYQNNVNRIKGIPVKPQLSLTPKYKRLELRMLRKLLQYSTFSFGVLIILAYVAAMIRTWSFEFWHVWGFFGG